MTIRKLQDRIETLEELNNLLRSSEHKLQIENRDLKQDKEILTSIVNGLRAQIDIVHNVTKFRIVR